MSFFNEKERKAGGFHFSFAGKHGWEREVGGDKNCCEFSHFCSERKFFQKQQIKSLGKYRKGRSVYTQTYKYVHRYETAFYLM